MGFRASETLAQAESFFRNAQAQTTFASAQSEFGLQQQQADLVFGESLTEAARIERAGKSFAASQAHQYLSSGVLLTGSPLAVIDETRRMAQEEADSVRRRGTALADLTRMKSYQTLQYGRNALFEAEAQGVIGGLRRDVERQQSLTDLFLGPLTGLFTAGAKKVGSKVATNWFGGP